jgi:hypothetical protein
VTLFWHCVLNEYCQRIEYWTLLDLSRIYTDRSFRERVVSRITDPAVGRFWREEFPSYDQRFQAEA